MQQSRMVSSSRSVVKRYGIKQLFLSLLGGNAKLGTRLSFPFAGMNKNEKEKGRVGRAECFFIVFFFSGAVTLPPNAPNPPLCTPDTHNCARFLSLFFGFSSGIILIVSSHRTGVGRRGAVH